MSDDREKLISEISRAICAVAYGEGEISEALQLYGSQYLAEAEAALAVAEKALAERYVVLAQSYVADHLGKATDYADGYMQACDDISAAIRKSEYEH